MNENIVNLDNWTDAEKNTFAQGVKYALIKVLKTELEIIREAQLTFPKDDIERREAALKVTKIMYKRFEEMKNECNEHIAKVQGYISYEDLLKHYATIYGVRIEA